MTPELWIQIIEILLIGGGLVTLFTISEKKTSAMLENMDKANQEWQKIVDHERTEISSLRERKDELDKAKANDLSEHLQREARLQDKIDKLYGEKSDVMRELDAANTRCMKAECYKCEVASCPNRKPPFVGE